LTGEELNKIETKQFKLSRLKRIRDIFVFVCYTGLSCSDLADLTPGSITRGIDGKNWIIYERNKTGVRAPVPILQQAQTIIEKYKNDPIRQPILICVFFLLCAIQLQIIPMDINYPVYRPSLTGNELKYVTDCIESTWISSKGRYINEFELKFANYIHAAYATSVCNGTVALHLALLALDIKPGDEVIVPTFTYIASVNAIAYVGATPVFVDSLPETWQMDCEDVKLKITPKTKAILAPHIYGHPCEMDSLLDICSRYQLKLVEDCAEAIGSQYKGKLMGTFGDIAAFSFFGNKTITTGEGGMVTTNSEELIERVKKLKNQGLSNLEYWHDEIGYNYRMTNICSAIGVAQLERIDEIIADKIRIASVYRKAFENSAIELQGEADYVLNSYWMCSVLIPSADRRDALRSHLSKMGIETRPLFYPVHTMKMYANLTDEKFPVAADISSRGINLPSYPELKNADVSFIANLAVNFIEGNG
jgi:perosamine synthetase